MDGNIAPSTDEKSGLKAPPLSLVSAASSSSSNSSRLNLPVGVSPLSVSAEPSTPSRFVDRLLNMGYQPSPSKTICGDRFIPSRSSSNFAMFNMAPPSPSLQEVKSEVSTAYITQLRSALLGHESGLAPLTPEKGFLVNPPNKNIFRYKTETHKPIPSISPSGFEDSLSGSNQYRRIPPRRIQKSPYKVLDAPALQDDFYLNLVDWSSQNILAVGLGNCVYMWNAFTSKVNSKKSLLLVTPETIPLKAKVTKLCDMGDDGTVSSVGWAQRGSHLAIGASNGKVQIWDASICKRVRSMGGHRFRVGALSWSSKTLSSGSRDKSILLRDVRAQDDFTSKLTGHRSEVCGLKWSHDNRQLASGGNDNRLLVWNCHSKQPVVQYSEHRAAVKAIAWSPHVNGLLASGGGTADRCIRFWNTALNSQIISVDTGSQVCNLVWSKNVDEIVSTHGFSQNQIILWNYPSMTKLTTLIGHSLRVLYLAVSPDGQNIVTGAGDETLRFWNVFPAPKQKGGDSGIGAHSFGRCQIR